MTNIAIENGHRKFVDFPIKNGGSFHSYVSLLSRIKKHGIHIVALQKIDHFFFMTNLYGMLLFELLQGARYLVIDVFGLQGLQTLMTCRPPQRWLSRGACPNDNESSEVGLQRTKTQRYHQIPLSV